MNKHYVINLVNSTVAAVIAEAEARTLAKCSEMIEAKLAGVPAKKVAVKSLVTERVRIVIDHIPTTPPESEELPLGDARTIRGITDAVLQDYPAFRPGTVSGVLYRLAQLEAISHKPITLIYSTPNKKGVLTDRHRAGFAFWIDSAEDVLKRLEG